MFQQIDGFFALTMPNSLKLFKKYAFVYFVTMKLKQPCFEGNLIVDKKE